MLPLCVALPIEVAGLNCTDRVKSIRCPTVIDFGYVMGGAKYDSWMPVAEGERVPNSLHVVPLSLTIVADVSVPVVSMICNAACPLDVVGVVL